MQKTWNEFWGEFLLVTFHKDNLDRWSFREKRARWLVETLNLSPGAKILNLGCGDGLLEICLGRLGMDVTGVDGVESTLNLAQKEVQAEKVEFIVADLREFHCPKQSYDAIIIFEVLGLMTQSEDAKLLASAARWLKPNGSLIADCPKESEQEYKKNEWHLPEGHLIFDIIYEPKTRIKTITPELRQPNSEMIDFAGFDRHSQEAIVGFQRYIYPMAELSEMLAMNGLVTREIEHFSSGEHYMLVGQKPKEDEGDQTS